MAMVTGDKLYYKIGEVARMASLKPSVLRFWEEEFQQLKPRKSSSGQRLYSGKDLELVLTIRNLLYNDKLTIEGARRVISRLTTSPAKAAPPETGNEQVEIRSLLQEIKAELMDCRRILER